VTEIVEEIMGIESVSENAAISGGDGGKGQANLIYILYIIINFMHIVKRIKRRIIRFTIIKVSKIPHHFRRSIISLI
jgi:hypothetical protein